MQKKYFILLILGAFSICFAIFSQQNAAISEEAPIATCPICATITPSPTITPMPTLSYEEKSAIFATAQAKASPQLWTTPLPTTPPNYPTPAFPVGNRENGLSVGLDPLFTKVVNETIIGKYIIREWSYSHSRLNFVTISAVGQEQFIPSRSGGMTRAKIEAVSGTDLTGDGNLEVVIRYHGEGNGFQCDYVSIYSLHEDGPVLVLDKAPSCLPEQGVYGSFVGYLDFFEDLDNNGKFEFIARVAHWPDDIPGETQVWQYDVEARMYKIVDFEVENNLSSHEENVHQLFVPQVVSGEPGDVRWLWVMSYPSAEASLIDILFYSSDKCISLIYKQQGKALGHIFFYPVTLTKNDQNLQIMGLISLNTYDINWAVEARTELINAGVKEARIQGYDAVALFGDPDFYSAFGFVPASEYGIQAEHELPDETFMILALNENALNNVQGVVKYPEAFWMIKQVKVKDEEE